MQINWGKVGTVAFTVVSALGSLAAVVTMFASQQDVHAWLVAHTPHVSPYALAAGAQLLLATMLAYAVVVIRKVEERAARLQAELDRSHKESDAIHEHSKSVVDRVNELDAMTKPDPSKCKLRVERVEVVGNSRTRGTATVSVSLDWPFGRALTIYSIELGYWRFDGRQIDVVNVQLKGAGTDVRPGGTIKFNLPLLEDEMNALFAALRTLQNSYGTDISGFFAHGVTTTHKVAFAGALVMQDDAKNVRLTLPPEEFDLATLVLNNVQNPYPPERDVTPSVKAPPEVEGYFAGTGELVKARPTKATPGTADGEKTRRRREG
jgi:hypothetical protein